MEFEFSNIIVRSEIAKSVGSGIWLPFAIVSSTAASDLRGIEIRLKIPSPWVSSSTSTGRTMELSSGGTMKLGYTQVLVPDYDLLIPVPEGGTSITVSAEGASSHSSSVATAKVVLAKLFDI